MRFASTSAGFSPAAASTPRLATLLAIASLFAAACDGCSETEAGAPCDTVYQGECGKPCAGDSECADGLHCGTDGKCTAECTPSGGECGEGVACTDRGRCGGDGGGGAGGSSTSTFGTGGAAQGGSGQGGGCADVTVTFAPQTPTVVLLIDQSGSMTAAFPGGNRWDVLYETLMDPATGIVKQLENQVRFGLALYTGDGGATCPLLTEVDIAIGNHAAIDAVYAPAGPIGETPTGDSITDILPELVAYPEPGPKIIVLATDGEPDTCEQPNPQMGQGEAIAAAQAAFGMGVRTYIIGVCDQVSDAHQQDMANAGQGLPLDGSMGNAPFYPANDQSALQAAFTEIINGVRSCKLTLDGSVDPAKAGEGEVLLDGMPLVFGDPNGWQLNSPTEIELLGTACETIQTGEHTVSGSFPCDAIGPPPR